MVSRKTSLVLRTRPVLTSQLGIQRDVCKYILPPQVFLSYNDQVVFGDVPSSSSVYDCPNTHTHCHIIDPILSRLPIEIKVPECSQTNSPKQARQILKIRRKKMKRHLLKKYRKRMMFTLRKQRRERRRKKEAIFLAKLVKIKQWGESFSARDYVLQELNKARRGGFYINVLAKK
ncbi:hypothetical protein BaRGS_00030811 [Batillaria attramentaria]|uniref:Mitochondrial mRNA-processing protein COX24 C-terminal domain-containing protein n=1 Tax=Batillaria attramentaria TaxID=370345 RepID=A0ABD0JTG8_9CAEN